MLSPTDLFRLKFVRDARLSPDGRQAAYTLSRTDDAEHLEIHFADLATGASQRLDFNGDARSARWSADGRRLAFVGNGRLYLFGGDSGRRSEPLTPEGWEVQGFPSWGPDSNRVAVSLVRRRTVSGPRRISTETYRADGVGYHDRLQQEIWIADCRSGSCTQLTQNLGLCFAPEWNPRADELLIFASTAPVPFSSYSPRLLTIEVEDGSVKEVLDARWYVTTAKWTPNGECIVIAAAHDSELTIPNLTLWLVGRNGKSPLHRTPGLMGNVGCRATHDMPVWDLTQSNVLVVLDEHSALASVHRGGAVEIWQVSLTGDRRMQVVVSGERTCIVLDADVARQRVLFAATDLLTPTELRCAGLDGCDERRITRLNDDVLEQWPRQSVHRLPFVSAGNLPIESWFMRRADTTDPLPTVLFIHGGPFSATGNAFRYDFHLLASRGYGVLFANFRGSAGYGEAFARAIMGDWCGKAYPDHIGAVDAAVSLGLADPDRLGVWGPSYGGSATCWIVGHTNRFKAAVAEAAGVNLATRYYISDIPDVFRRDLGGTPHELPDVYRERSPITYARNCTTPTLLLHGEDDLRCPISEAEQFFRALQDVGCITELFRIPNCSHLGDSIGPLSARAAQNEALIDWFQRFL